MKETHFTGGRIPRILSGSGLSGKLPGYISESRKTLIVTDRGYAALGVPERIRASVEGAGIGVSIFSDIAREPTEHCMNAAVAEMQKGYDTVVGIGGGSALDAAKAAAFAGRSHTTVAELSANIEKAKRTVRLVMIPTTCGTGSEVTPNALYLDGENNKSALISPEMIADLVLLDAGLLVTLPPHITACTGMDALSHCMESYTSNRASPVSDAYALEGIRLIAENLPAAVGGDADARAAMLSASLLGGLALSAAGTSAVHALAYPLGKRGVTHGMANGTLLVPVFEELALHCETKLRRAALCFGTDVQGMLRTLSDWWRAFEMPRSLRALHIRELEAEAMAEEAMTFTRLLQNAPMPFTAADALKIYQKLM